MRRITTFTVAAGIILLLAFDDGGYDVVTRSELGIVVWAAVALGVAFGVFPRGEATLGAWIGLSALGALALFSLFALGWTETDEGTVEEVARVLQYAGLVALAYLALNQHTWRAAAAGLAFAALAVPVFSITARLAPDLITDETAQLFATDRLSYPFGYWNGVAAWGAMAIAFGLSWSAHARLVPIRALALALVPVAALSVFLTYSRAGVIAVPLALLAALALARNRWTLGANAAVAAAASGAVIAVAHSQTEIARATGEEGAALVLLALLVAAGVCAVAAAGTRAAGLDRVRLQREHAIFAVAIGVVIMVSAIAPLAHSQIGDLWEDFKDEESLAIASGSADPTARLTTLGSSRYEAWGTAIDAYETEPDGGIGPGSYEFFWSREGDSPEFGRDAHSLYLEQLAELGILGLLLILVALGALLATALAARTRLAIGAERGASAAAIAAFIVFLVYAGVDWLWELPAITGLALGGVAVAGAAAFPRWGRAPVGGRTRGVLIGVALLALAIQVPPLVSNERQRASADELARGDLERAEELADSAVSAAPWAATPYAQRALVSEERGDFEQARTDLERAIEKEPTNWRHHFLLAQVEAKAGRLAALKAQLAEVERLAPNSIFLIPGSPARREIDALLEAEADAAPARRQPAAP